MIVLRELRRRARQIAGPVLGMALCCYFAYHLVEGERGLLAWRQLTGQYRSESARLAALRAEHAALARRDAELMPDNLDPDLLDERVRATLNLVGSNEVVIMQKPAAQ
jgi:cell division protein FtsB